MLTPTSRTSWEARRFRRWWRTGRFAIGTIGFGMKSVSGRSRVPRPAAMIIAFTRGACCPACRASEPVYGRRCTPASVTIAVTRFAGVTSNAGFRAGEAVGDLERRALLDRRFSSPRRRVVIDRGRRRDDDERNLVMRREHRETIRADLVRHVTVRGDAIGADDDVRDAADAMTAPAAPSTITVKGMPSCSSSHAVSRAPWSAGGSRRRRRGSRRPRACAARTAPSAEPCPAVASAPVLQWVRTAQPGAKSDAACSPIATQRATSSRWIARARSASTSGVGSRLPHLGERPREVDRRRPGGHEHGRGGVEVLTVLRSERVAHAPPPHRSHGAPRTASMRIASATSAGRSALQLDDLVGQTALVEEDDTVVLEPDDVLGPRDRAG